MSDDYPYMSLFCFNFAGLTVFLFGLAENDPAERISAKAELDHPYFDSLEVVLPSLDLETVLSCIFIWITLTEEIILNCYVVIHQ